MGNALRDVTGGSPSLWRERCHVTRDAIASAETRVSVADDTRIDSPGDTNTKTLLEDVCSLKEHMEKGGRLGWGPFRSRLVKERMYVLKKVRVNGRSCSNLEQFSLLADALRVQVALEKTWGFWAGCYEKTEGPYVLQLQSIKALCEALEGVLSLQNLIDQCRNALKKCPSLSEPIWADESQIERVVASCRLAMARAHKEFAAKGIRAVETLVGTANARKDAHPMVAELLNAVQKRDIHGFASAKAKCDALEEDRRQVQRVDECLKRFRLLAPRLTEELERTCNEPCWDTRIQNIRNAWHWAQARLWVEEYIRKEDAPSLATRVKQIEDEINTTIAKLASLHAWSFCFSRLQEDHQRHMQQWQWHMEKGGKFTGKNASYHRKEAQKHLNGCREAVPAWVMPLHRVWDTIDPAPGMFDVVVVDEASQCGPEALPLLYLGKRILIVGDDKQISPDAVGVPRNAVHCLMQEYLHDFKFKDSFDVETSLFHHGKLRYGIHRVALKEHFRCMPEIIRFSNDLCYSDTPLIPLRQYGPERLTPPLEHVFVEGGYREGSGNRVINRPEAEVVVNKIVELCQDPRYADKSMGVVVLQGEAQAGLIEAQLLERVGAEEMERRRLICGNAYSFQGDERDIMFLSMVAAPNETIGPLAKPADERRFNVAASRARDQMYLFHSVTCDDLSVSCLRRRLLEFFENTEPPPIGEPDQGELERRAAQDNRVIVKPPHPFDSWFEVDVALELLRKGFIVTPQFEVAGKRIDLVVEGGQARLAVECDGDEWHGADRYEADMQRQRMLERCGWEFFRVRECAFYANKEEALQGLWRALEERGIRPFVRTENLEPQTAVQPDKTAGGCEDGSNIEGEGTDKRHDAAEQTAKVRVGSTVVYVNDDDGRVCQALITTDKSNPEWGMVNVDTPIAKALIGEEVGHVVLVHLPVGPARLRIVEIR
jgi:very-short-patch-repair endonuclease